MNVLYAMTNGLPVYVDWNLWSSRMTGRPSDVEVLYERDEGAVPPVAMTFDQWATYERQPRPSVGEVDADFLRHALFGMVPIAAKYLARGETDHAAQLLRSIGAVEVPPDATGQMTVVRERLAALGQGERGEAVSAITHLCDAVEELLSPGSPTFMA